MSTLAPICFAEPPEHADDHSTGAPGTPAKSRVVVIEFAESGPSLRRIEVAEVTFPEGAIGRRRHGRPNSRIPVSMTVVVQVCLLAVIVVVAVLNPVAGAGIAGTVLAGVFGLAVTRGMRTSEETKRDETLP
ncbi:hypothetical protein [Amycolatopsis regifaucium]|uniref:hypothetical protein n=1 Tax=Amycolatopsis regifaucium TaxID=546365 RepID=UPI0008F62DA2|nr:hypothetical protein [Amycolatopsis regifaucium]SFG70260.1 hypothetical protein SAMN04489731_101203 [Amycolatopsis regifaucium]